jgi:thiol-disulfide isomerase/thioredoxin
MPFPIVLLLALLPQTPQSAPPRDALALLNEVSQRYADAKSYHIEAVEEDTSSNELSRHWDKRLLTVIVMADGRFHYEGRSGFGSAIVVSDGTVQWDYHPYDHLYTQQPASSDDPFAGHIFGGDEEPLLRARALLPKMAHSADIVKSATFLPDETISVDGKNVDCYVIHYFDEPSRTGNFTFEWTSWIDKSRKVVVKTFSRRREAYALTLSGGHLPMSTETTVTYSIVALGQPEPGDSFAFVPPTDAKLVTEFPNLFARNPQTADPGNLTGKPAPEIHLKSPDGKIVALSSFRGKPVFIEFWATWCLPCVELMPGLATLHAETADKGLAWVSIDYDKDPKAVAAFLSRDHIPWPNYHDGDGSLGKAFHRAGIPLGVLIDADGKVTFYKAGYGIAELRTAIAKLGPEFSPVAPANANAAGATSHDANSK